MEIFLNKDDGFQTVIRVERIFQLPLMKKEILVTKISYLCIYDLYGPVHNVFDACRSIARASGRGLGPGNRDFFGPVK
jgi:hypothetical protein